MNDYPVVLVYKTRDRDLLPLQEACDTLKRTLRVVDCEEEFRKEYNQSLVSCIVVPLGTQEHGSDNAVEFANVAAKILQPEDADVCIVYSSEGYTPFNWPSLAKIDPRPIQSYDDNSLQFISVDERWRKTIEKIQSFKGRPGHHRNPNREIVRTEFKEDSDVPFPSEAQFLLRAAFKDMSKISVEFPKQGLSGSIACVIQPYDGSGHECKRVFVKIYPDQEKAQKELFNYLSYVEPYFDSGYYPTYQHFRRYRGKAYSLTVTDLTEGPGNEALTFKEMILQESFTAEQIRAFIEEVIGIMAKWPLSKPPNPRDLFNEYLKEIFDSDDKKLKLDSENLCHRWFGDLGDDLTIEQKIRNSLFKVGREATTSRICHGDLHGDNIMVKEIGGKLLPVLIDFSRTSETHSIKDLVTLESDMIIRGLTGIETFHDKARISSFLKSLDIKGGKSCLEKQGLSEDSLSRLEKIRVVTKELRKNAFSFHGVAEIEYAGAALLRTLEILSYGKLPRDQNVRATTYVSYLCERIRRLSKG